MGKSEVRESRALSARSRRWQSPWPAVAAFAAVLAGAPALAVPGGELGTLEQGSYVCELPGAADGAAGRHVAAADFTIISASSYTAHGRIGSYLLTGNIVTMTSGPHKGERFRRLYRGFLRQIAPDGLDGRLRCVLARLNNS